MATAAEIAEGISRKFDLLSGGIPDKAAERAMFQQLAQDFAALSQALKPTSGWAAATGTADRTTFDTATVTTTNLAKRVKALIDDLTTRGILSA